MAQTAEIVKLEFETEDLDLIESGLRLLLLVEDDTETIDRLKTLLDRVRTEKPDSKR